MDPRRRSSCGLSWQQLAELCEKSSGTVIHRPLPDIYPLSGGDYGKRQDLYLERKRVRFPTEIYRLSRGQFLNEDISTQIGLRPLTWENLWLAGKGREQKPSRRLRKQDLLDWRDGVFSELYLDEAKE
jgi:hypothetical protein